MLVLLALLVGGLALSAAETASTVAAPGNPYLGIVERNAFGLKPPPPVVEPEVVKPPPPKITLTGITTILGNKRALLRFTPPAKPGEPPKEQGYTLAEGQREGDLEVLEIDEKAGTVKVSNYGTIATLDFENNGIKNPGGGAPPGPVAPPGVPPGMRPGMPLPGAMGGAMPMPARPLRVPGTPGAAYTPQQSPGAGLPLANPAVNPSVAAQPVGFGSAEESVLLLELNRIKNQPLVEAGLMPPLPRHEMSDEARAAIIGSDPAAAAPVAAPAPVMPRLAPTIPLPLPPPQAAQ